MEVQLTVYASTNLEKYFMDVSSAFQRIVSAGCCSDAGYGQKSYQEFVKNKLRPVRSLSKTANGNMRKGKIHKYGDESPGSSGTLQNYVIQILQQNGNVL
jgi:hypothetical protein